MLKISRHGPLATLLGAALLCCGACNDGGRRLPKEKRPEPAPRPASAAERILADTIGAQVQIGSGVPIRLRGFGLIVGLGEDGGSDCPTTIREYLVDYLSREFAPGSSGDRRPKISPERMIDSLDTSVVAVHGLVPAGAPHGTRFDLQIEAVDTQTRSLAGGVLLPCELKQFDVSAAGKGLVAGRPLAKARGLVFTNPFATGERPHQSTS